MKKNLIDCKLKRKRKKEKKNEKNEAGCLMRGWGELGPVVGERVVLHFKFFISFYLTS